MDFLSQVRGNIFSSLAELLRGGVKGTRWESLIYLDLFSLWFFNGFDPMVFITMKKTPFGRNMFGFFSNQRPYGKLRVEDPIESIKEESLPKSQWWKLAATSWLWLFALPSLKLTRNLKVDGWNSSFLLGWPIFRCYVSFRECILGSMLSSDIGIIISQPRGCKFVPENILGNYPPQMVLVSRVWLWFRAKSTTHEPV